MPVVIKIDDDPGTNGPWVNVGFEDVREEESVLLRTVTNDEGEPVEGLLAELAKLDDTKEALDHLAQDAFDAGRQYEKERAGAGSSA